MAGAAFSISKNVQKSTLLLLLLYNNINIIKIQLAAATKGGGTLERGAPGCPPGRCAMRQPPRQRGPATAHLPAEAPPATAPKPQRPQPHLQPPPLPTFQPQHLQDFSPEPQGQGSSLCSSSCTSALVSSTRLRAGIDKGKSRLRDRPRAEPAACRRHTPQAQGAAYSSPAYQRCQRRFLLFSRSKPMQICAGQLSPRARTVLQPMVAGQRQQGSGSRTAAPRQQHQASSTKAGAQGSSSRAPHL